MISGAREGKSNIFRKWLLGSALASNLKAFVIPGQEFVRRAGLDLNAAGIEVSVNPRQANLLLIIGPLPSGLQQAAAVVLAQMPRPRAILAIGNESFSVIPSPDIRIEPTQLALTEGVQRLQKLFAGNSWMERVPAFPFAEENPEDKNQPGMDMGHHGMSDPNMSMPQPMMHDHDMLMDHNNMDSNKQLNQGDIQMGHDEQMQMGEGEMDMDMGGGFMSMVSMTQDLPRSRDGLPMEWAEAPFGPLFPGLPAGLALSFTLDGDSVAKVNLDKGVTGHELEKTWPGPVEGFVDRFSRLEPTTPLAYRFLAVRALAEAQAIQLPQAESAAKGWVWALERERIISHLGWLADLGFILGYTWLAQQAGKWQLALVGIKSQGELAKLRPGLLKFIQKAERTPLIKSRLEKTGKLEDKQAQALTGPLGRSNGQPVDGRNSEPAYQNLGFKPVICQGKDAFARLKLRLLEIRQSFDLIEAAGNLFPPGFPGHLPLESFDGTGTATVETPRGPATLTLSLQAGKVKAVSLETPSTRNVELLSQVCEGQSLADALVGVVSLDLSAWELDR